MNYLTYFSRYFVGILFIVSGFVKANDVLGFSYKLEEYFAPGVLSIDFLIPYALLLACVVCIFEIILGLMLLSGSFPKFTSWSSLLMILFFTFLTFYSAYFNKVTDCGCFGDAIKLKPWESFIKDIILLFFITIIFINKNLIKPIFSNKTEKYCLTLFFLFPSSFIYITYNYLPIKDFRPYNIGTNIIESMKTCDELGLPCPEKIDYYLVKNKKTGLEKEILSSDWNWKEDDFVSNTGKFLEKSGYEPKIRDFSISNNNFDFTDSILNSQKCILIIAYDLEKTSKKAWVNVVELLEKSNQNNLPIFILTASASDKIEIFNNNFRDKYSFLFTDETVLKTIIRSNPGVLLLSKGTIVNKWHHNDFPSFIEIQQNLN